MKDTSYHMLSWTGRADKKHTCIQEIYQYNQPGNLSKIKITLFRVEFVRPVIGCMFDILVGLMIGMKDEQ